MVVLGGNGRGLVVVLGGNGGVSSISLQNYDQFSFPNRKKELEAKLVVVVEGNGRNQGVRGFELKGYFLLTDGSIQKREIEDKFVFRPPFIPIKISLE